jgi:hypothetical protein
MPENDVTESSSDSFNRSVGEFLSLGEEEEPYGAEGNTADEPKQKTPEELQAHIDNLNKALREERGKLRQEKDRLSRLEKFESLLSDDPNEKIRVLQEIAKELPQPSQQEEDFSSLQSGLDEINRDGADNEKTLLMAISLLAREVQGQLLLLSQRQQKYEETLGEFSKSSTSLIEKATAESLGVQLDDVQTRYGLDDNETEELLSIWEDSRGRYDDIAAEENLSVFEVILRTKKPDRVTAIGKQAKRAVARGRTPSGNVSQPREVPDDREQYILSLLEEGSSRSRGNIRVKDVLSL